MNKEQWPRLSTRMSHKDQLGSKWNPGNQGLETSHITLITIQDKCWGEYLQHMIIASQLKDD